MNMTDTTSPTPASNDGPLRAKVLSDYYRRAPVSMQCNQSSGERFPGDWEGLAAMNVPLPSLETVNNNQDECSD